MNYIKSYSREKRKKNGVFYTPRFLADYLSEKVFQYIGKKNNYNSILDPACGDSMLLRSFADKLLSIKNNKKHPIFFGVDKDIDAVQNSILKFSKDSFKGFNTNFIHCDGLFPNAEKTTVQGWSELKEKLKIRDGFDIALSNPPWGADLNNYESQKLYSNFVLARKQFDIYNLFIEIILNNLNENGYYGLIIPDSVFNQEQSGLRGLLVKNTTINLIARLGEKIFPEINRACVVIIGQKKIPKENHKVDCFRLSPGYKKKVIANELTLGKIEEYLSHKVPQARFIENENYIFDIDLKVDARETYDKISKDSIPLKIFVNNTRGAEISKKGIVWQCANCNNWTPEPRAKEPKCKRCNTVFSEDNTNKENIILNHNGDGNVKLKVGEDLFRYTSKSKSWINTRKDGINYKKMEIYQGDKILVRKTGVGITACIDYDNTINNQVVYILKVNPIYKSIISLEFILSVLNSRVITYYLLKKYGDNEWKSHPYLTQTMLINLPFPNLDFKSTKVIKVIEKITDLVKKEVTRSKSKNISKKSDLIIERAIADLYGLNQEDYKNIYEALSSSEQLIPITRLLECTVKEIFD